VKAISPSFAQKRNLRRASGSYNFASCLHYCTPGPGFLSSPKYHRRSCNFGPPLRSPPSPADDRGEKRSGKATTEGSSRGTERPFHRPRRLPTHRLGGGEEMRLLVAGPGFASMRGTSV
jgi:hypothetical protein